MKKLKIYSFFFILIFTKGCGYTPIYSSNNLDLKFNKIEYAPNTLNRQIFQTLTSLSNSTGKKEYDVKFKTIKQRNIVSKNSKGDTETYELKITLDLNVNNDGIEYFKKFSSKIKYSNNDNKFELNQYEVEIEKQIVNDLIERIIIFFSEI